MPTPGTSADQRSSRSALPLPWSAKIAKVFAGAVFLLASLVGLLWLAGQVLTDRYVTSQYLYWGELPLAAALVAITLLGTLISWAARAGKRLRRLRRLVLSFTLIAVAWTLGGAFNAPGALTPGFKASANDRPISLVHWNASAQSRVLPQETLAELAKRPMPDVLLMGGRYPAAHRQDILFAMGEGATGVGVGDVSLYTRLPIIASHKLILPLKTPPEHARPPALLTGAMRRVFSLIGANWRELDEVEPIDLLVVQLDTKARFGRPLVVYFIDMPSNPALGRMSIVRQAKEAIEKLQASTGADRIPKPDVIVGDFNAPRGSASIDLLTPGLSHARTGGSWQWLASWPRTTPLLQIDHVYIAPWLRASRYEIVDPGRSEHRAQTLDLFATK